MSTPHQCKSFKSAMPRFTDSTVGSDKGKRFCFMRVYALCPSHHARISCETASDLLSKSTNAGR